MSFFNWFKFTAAKSPNFTLEQNLLIDKVLQSRVTEWLNLLSSRYARLKHQPPFTEQSIYKLITFDLQGLNATYPEIAARNRQWLQNLLQPDQSSLYLNDLRMLHTSIHLQIGHQAMEFRLQEFIKICKLQFNVDVTDILKNYPYLLLLPYLNQSTLALQLS